MTQDRANEDTQVNYGKIYEGFYSKYYDQLEQFAKDFFIAKKGENRNYNYARNNIEIYLYNDYVKDAVYTKNDNLNKLHSIFHNRASYYDREFMLDVFKNEIKNNFDEIDKTRLPKDYNYLKFIEEVAFIESRNELFRLISAHAQLFEMIYKLNRFDIFEIRYYQGKDIEEYPNYGEMFSELYPDFKKNENLGVAENELIEPKQLPEKWYALLYWIDLNANGQMPPKNSEGQFIKKEIEVVGRIKTGRGGQGFYTWVKEIADDLNDEKKLNRTFKNWKKTIIGLSKNDPKIIDYIQKKYPS